MYIGNREDTRQGLSKIAGSVAGATTPSATDNKTNPTNRNMSGAQCEAGSPDKPIAVMFDLVRRIRFLGLSRDAGFPRGRLNFGQPLVVTRVADKSPCLNLVDSSPTADRTSAASCSSTRPAESQSERSSSTFFFACWISSSAGAAEGRTVFSEGFLKVL